MKDRAKFNFYTCLDVLKHFNQLDLDRIEIPKKRLLFHTCQKSPQIVIPFDFKVQNHVKRKFDEYDVPTN